MIEVDGQTIHEIQRQTHDEIRYKSKKSKMNNKVHKNQKFYAK